MYAVSALLYALSTAQINQVREDFCLMAYTNWTLRDYSGESSGVTIYNGDITAVSLPGFLTAVGTGRAAIEGITLGIVAKEQWVGDNTVLSAESPTNVFAQRELKWLVRYHDDVTQDKAKLEIPTADPTGVMLPASDFADLTVEPMLTFVNWFQGFARHPDNSVNAVVIDSIQLVGRNI